MTRRQSLATAVAASALLAGTIAVDANAATARVGPVSLAGTPVASLTLMADPPDACRMLIDLAVLRADAGAPILPVWEYPRRPLTACQRVFEDGSALGYADIRFPRAILRAGGRYFLAVRVWSKPRAAGTRWSSHTYMRSFWAPR